jgi:hypothetical protein
MKLRVSELVSWRGHHRERVWVIEYLDLFGWDLLFRRFPNVSYVAFRHREDADEYVRLYRAIKKYRKR